jgi:hypothetical protein
MARTTVAAAVLAAVAAAVAVAVVEGLAHQHPTYEASRGAGRDAAAAAAIARAVAVCTHAEEAGGGSEARREGTVPCMGGRRSGGERTSATLHDDRLRLAIAALSGNALALLHDDDVGLLAAVEEAAAEGTEEQHHDREREEHGVSVRIVAVAAVAAEALGDLVVAAHGAPAGARDVRRARALPYVPARHARRAHWAAACLAA